MLKLIIGFLLTGVIGNYLVQRWQARSWLRQQRFAGTEKEYNSLKEIADEISSLLGSRVFWMRRLHQATQHDNAKRLDLALEKYDEVVQKWNERLPVFFSRLSDTGLNYRLERSVQTKLVITGGRIEAAVRTRRQGESKDMEYHAAIDREMDGIQGAAISFNEILYATVKSKRFDVYYGVRLKLSYSTLRKLSTWQLVKIFFVRDVDSFSVTRSPLDS